MGRRKDEDLPLLGSLVVAFLFGTSHGTEFRTLGWMGKDGSRAPAEADMPGARRWETWPSGAVVVPTPATHRQLSVARS